MKREELKNNMRLTFSNGRSATVLLRAAVKVGETEYELRDLIRYEDGAGFDYLFILQEDGTHRNMGPLVKVQLLSPSTGEPTKQVWPKEVKKLTLRQIANELGYPFELVTEAPFKGLM